MPRKEISYDQFGMKICAKCKKTGHFYVSNRSKDGRDSQCKICVDERGRINRERRKDGKRCTKCGKFGEFYQQKNNVDGLQCWCKTCIKANNKVYYARNKPDTNLGLSRRVLWTDTEFETTLDFLKAFKDFPDTARMGEMVRFTIEQLQVNLGFNTQKIEGMLEKFEQDGILDWIRINEHHYYTLNGETNV